MAQIRIKLCCGSLCLLVLAGASGCSNSDVETALSRAEQQRQSTEAMVKTLQDRVSVLEGKRGMTFVVSDFNVKINEQMFQPQLSASATLKAKGDNLPETLYVDLMLMVEVEREKFKVTSRQIFPINASGGEVVLRQSLPVHGLTRDQIKVVLQPVNWYAGQLIAESQIQYQ